jgi:predicted PurR-regulated permease PerM
VVIVVWTIIQNIEAVIVVPRIMGESLNLHPVVVIVGVIAGANIAGILGVLLAAPVIASLRVIAQYLYGKLMDRDPFPEPPRRDTPAPSIIDRVLRALRTRRAVVQSSQ